MKVIKIEPQGFASNTYILTADDRSAVLIDCAQPRVLTECKRRGLTPEYVLLTHSHFDHIGGLQALYDSGCKLIATQECLNNMLSGTALISPYIPMPHVEFSHFVSEGEVLLLCGMLFKAYLTPGHTSCSVCYEVEDHLFTGDTLFCESVGRTDLPSGNFGQLKQSIQKLFSLQGDRFIHCGHESDTTLDHERTSNPYVR